MAKPDIAETVVEYNGREPVRSMPIEDFVNAIQGFDDLMRAGGKVLGVNATTSVRPPEVTEDGAFRIAFETEVTR